MRGRLGLARACILTILDEEFEAVQEAFDSRIPIPGSSYFATGGAPYEVVVSQVSDRSQMPMMEAAAGILEDFRPELLAVTGIAGGLADRDDVGRGDVVVASYLHYWEFRKLVKGGDLHRYFAYDQPSVSIRQNYVLHAKAEKKWVQNLNTQRPLQGEPRVFVGSLVSAEKVWSDAEHSEQQKLLARFSDAIAVDMEAIGVARAVHAARSSVDYNPRLLIVRGISDVVRPATQRRLLAWFGNRRHRGANPPNVEERAIWKRYASCVAAAFSRDVVDRLLQSRDPRS